MKIKFKIGEKTISLEDIFGKEVKGFEIPIQGQYLYFENSKDGKKNQYHKKYLLVQFVDIKYSLPENSDELETVTTIHLKKMNTSLKNNYEANR